VDVTTGYIVADEARVRGAVRGVSAFLLEASALKL
jgi:hypothetical protein